jgi:hypothetical protein
LSFFVSFFVSALVVDVQPCPFPPGMIAPLRVVWCGIQLGEDFPAGWEGWLEGAHQAQLSFGLEDSVCVAVLHVERNGFSVLAE